MPGVTPQGMDYHHSYGGMNGHGGGYGYGPGPRNGYGGPDMDQHSMDRFDNTRDMEPTIEVDHLATYSSKSGVMKPEDGLRKLRGMESTTGIWTMRCMMIIERKNLIIVDKGNGEELERFPLDLVHEPTAIFKEDKREVYTNLILFTILENPGKYNNRCDMHIFQSINAPAQEIVDEILAAKEGRPKLLSSSIPPPPMGPAPDPPGKGFYGQTQNRALYEASSGQNENLERDVQFLNCCFDDIEKFVARLQQAAEAYKELENRKRERQSHKKKNDKEPPPRDGMLNMRARPPPADDFIDIFKKIKWAFNLLAKLKAHIHDPNAPELVHFIFTPLSLIYEASRDPVHAGIDLASKAVSPLLTREAKELLLNCLTSKELELWQLLGRNWTTSEDETQTNQCKQTIDKDQLEQSLVNHRHQIDENTRTEDARNRGSMSQQMSRQLPTPREDQRHDDPPYGRTRRDEEPPYHTGPPGGYSRHIGTSFVPEMDNEPIRREPMYQKTRPQENAEFKDDLRRKNAKIFEAVHERNGRNQKEITVEKGDILEVLDDSRNWWRLRNYKGETGYAPYTILRDIGDDRNDVDRNGGHRGSVGGYSGNIGHSQSNHIPAAPPPPRKEEEFERVIKPIHHMRNDSDGRSDGSDRYRHGRRQEQKSGSTDRHFNSDRTSDSSDGEHFSGSLDGSIEDIVVMRSRNYRENDRKQNQNPYHRHSDEIRNQKNARAHNNRSFEDDPAERQKIKPPPPPPKSGPPPPPPQNKPPSGRMYTPPGNGRRAERDELHNELSKKLNGKPVIKTKPQNHNLYLSTKSSTYDVTDWLRSKSFSERCIDQLSGYNGYDLLRMKAKDINSLIEHDEAQRLTGHLTLQKNMSGYKTQGAKELQAILQQRKQKADTIENDDVNRPPGFAPDSPDYSDDNSEVEGITAHLDNILSQY